MRLLDSLQRGSVLYMLHIEGTIKRGLQIASGTNPDRSLRLNNTIALQRPFFKEHTLPGVDQLHNGTINVDISPREFRITKPAYEITCTWFEDVTETFWFVPVQIEYGHVRTTGYIYYPCPSAIKSHPDTLVELLAPFVPGIVYGNPIAFLVSQEHLHWK